MDDPVEIRKLARRLKAHGVKREIGVLISLEIRRGDKREKMMQWLDENPGANVSEICEKSQTLHDEAMKELRETQDNPLIN